MRTGSASANNIMLHGTTKGFSTVTAQLTRAQCQSTLQACLHTLRQNCANCRAGRPHAIVAPCADQASSGSGLLCVCASHI
jgi:hypothetical protein